MYYAIGSLNGLKRRHSRSYLALSMSALLLAQALFPLQAHTQWERQQDGAFVLICSIDGARVVHLPRHQEDEDGSLGLNISPAYTFSQLMGEAVTADARSSSARLYMAWILRPEAITHFRRGGFPRNFSIRAPPS